MGQQKLGWVRKAGLALTIFFAGTSYGRCLFHAAAAAIDHHYAFHAAGVLREFKLRRG